MLFLLAIILVRRIASISSRVVRSSAPKAMEQLHKDAQELDDQVRALEVRMREIRAQRESASRAAPRVAQSEVSMYATLFDGVCRLMSGPTRRWRDAA